MPSFGEMFSKIGLGAQGTTHVANASNLIIHAKVDERKDWVKWKETSSTSAKLTGKVAEGLSAEVSSSHSFSAENVQSPVVPGLTAIAPGTYFAFRADDPVVTVIVHDPEEHVISNGANPGWNKSVIITPQLTLVNAEYGAIWTDKSGRVYAH